MICATILLIQFLAKKEDITVTRGKISQEQEEA
jgi:hypothetical protein